MTQPNDPYYGQQGGDPQSGAPYSGQPYSGQPQSGQPYSGQPYSGQPYSGQPYSGQPYSGQPYAGQQYGDPYSGGYGNPHGMQTGQPYTGPQPGAPYGQQPGPYAPPRGTNQNAILALVLAFVFAPLGIYFGSKAKKEIAVTGEDGEGMATAGVVIGWVGTGMLVLAVLLFCGSFALAACGAAVVGGSSV